jgi:hypothetical protein
VDEERCGPDDGSAMVNAFSTLITLRRALSFSFFPPLHYIAMFIHPSINRRILWKDLRCTSLASSGAFGCMAEVLLTLRSIMKNSDGKTASGICTTSRKDAKNPNDLQGGPY